MNDTVDIYLQSDLDEVILDETIRGDFIIRGEYLKQICGVRSVNGVRWSVNVSRD